MNRSAEKSESRGRFCFSFGSKQVVHGWKRYLAVPSETDASDPRRVTTDHYNLHRSVAVPGDRQGSLSSHVFGPRDQKAGREGRGDVFT